MNMTQALNAIKTGRKIRRKEWKDGISVQLHPHMMLGTATVKSIGEVQAVDHLLLFDKGSTTVFLYSPSVADISATDWEAV